MMDFSIKDSETLCMYIIAYRSLGCMKEEAKLSMQELMRRKIINKDNFDFDAAINQGLEEAKISIETPKISDFKKAMISPIINEILSNKEELLSEEPEQPDDNIENINEKQQKDLEDISEALKDILKSS